MNKAVCCLSAYSFLKQQDAVGAYTWASLY